MHVVFFVEEPSVEAALTNLLPRLLPDQTTFQFIVFQGKPDLLDNLLSRLRGYANWLPEDWRIVVLIDEDRQDCFQLKRQLETAVLSAGLISKNRNESDRFQVLTRIAIEELEAWFLGDVEALRQVYPRLPASLAHRQRFRDPDRVVGGTWEALEHVLQANGYHPTGYPKIDAARQISLYMDPACNRSHSFEVFCRGLEAL
jgi:hypothetical protein